MINLQLRTTSRHHHQLHSLPSLHLPPAQTPSPTSFPPSTSTSTNTQPPTIYTRQGQKGPKRRNKVSSFGPLVCLCLYFIDYLQVLTETATSDESHKNKRRPNLNDEMHVSSFGPVSFLFYSYCYS
jgi:hypothetical protein